MDQQTQRQGMADVLIVVAILIMLHRATMADFGWMLWSDRDLARSAAGAGFTEWMGAELSYGSGARIPGAGLHYMYAIPMVVTDDPAWIYRWQGLGELLAMTGLAAFLAMRFDRMVAAVALATWCALPITERVMAGLWHPTLMVPWVALALCMVLQPKPRPLHAGIFAAAVSFGAQMHMSVWFMLVALPWVARRQLAAWGAVGVGLLVPLVPYLVMEGITGFPNSRAFMSGEQLTDLGVNSPRFLANLGVMTTQVVGPPDEHFRNTYPSLRWLGTAATAAMVVGLRGVPAAVRQHPRELSALAVLTFAPVAWYLRSSVVDLSQIGSERYLLVLAAPLGVAMGLAAAQLGSRTKELVLFLLLLGMGARWADRALNEPHVPSAGLPYSDIALLVDGMAQAFPTMSLGEAVMRTRVVEDPTYPPNKPLLGIDHLIDPSDRAHPATEGPCAIAWMMPDAPQVPAGGTLQRVVELPKGRSIAVFTHPDPCHTSFANRYLSTPVEEATAKLGLEDGQVRVVDGIAHGRVGWLHLALSVQDTTLTLHANQLRGLAYNDGWFFNLQVKELRLELVGESTHVLPLAERAGDVGGHVGPFITTAPEGSWQVRVRGTLVEPERTQPLDLLLFERQPLEAPPR